MRKLYTAEDLAQIVGCVPKTIYNQVAQGEIPHVRIGRLIRFDPDVIERWIKEGHDRVDE